MSSGNAHSYSMIKVCQQRLPYSNSFSSSVDFRFGGTAPKYGKCVTVRKYQLVGEHAVVIKHFDTSKSQ